MWNARTRAAAVAVLIAVAVVWIAAGGLRAGRAYYVTVPEIFQQQDQLSGRLIRVAGYVAENSIERREGQLRFELELKGESIPVVYSESRPVPDTFQPGVDTVVEGHYKPGQSFQATRIQTKCASRYESAPSGDGKS